MDSWAFLVLAECYDETGDTSRSTLEFLGWSSQLVVYKEEASHYIGTQTTGATFAEREALFWAGQWRLSVNDRVPTIFLSDSQTGCDQATGLAGASFPDISYRNLRATFQALATALPDDGLRVQHVHGHNGCPWNEAVDLLAKHECQHQFYVDRQELCMKAWGPILPHLWLFLGDTKELGLPPLTSHGFDISPIDLPTLDTAHESVRAPSSSSELLKPVALRISWGTYNVRSLYRGPDGHAGKLHYACSQFEQHGLNFLGIQEARSEQGLFRHSETLRLSSGCHKGQLGVELWVNLAQPYGIHGGRALHFQAKHFIATYQDPRCLLLRVHTPHLQAWICVAHAPHCGTPEETRVAWWRSLQHRLHQYCAQEHLFLLLDANATSGQQDDVHVFSNDSIANANTDDFRDLLGSCNLCLPSTSSMHQGEDATWINPAGSHDQRIDYVAVPLDFLGAVTYSTDLHTLDFASDHVGTALQLEWEISCSPSSSSSRSTSKIAYDRQSIDRSRSLHQRLDANMSLTWSTNIESHVSAINGRILAALDAQCPKQQAKAKKPYMTQALWELRGFKLQARAALKALRRRLSSHLLGVFFMAWKTGGTDDAGTASEIVELEAYTASLRCYTVKYFVRYHTVAHRLRDSLRGHKLKMLQTQLDQLPPDISASAILRDLKSFIGPTNPRKARHRALPLIHHPDGTPCLTPQEIVDCWVNFFKVMEGGSRMTADDLRASWISSLDMVQTREQTIDLTTLPSLLDLEMAYRRVAPRKATGDDNVPGEVCRQQPVAIASLTYPCLLKLACQGQEALIHKGGQLVPVWKHKGPQCDVSSYRSILVSSHIGKGLHRALRQRQQDLYTAYLHHGQLGGRPHVPVGLGLHAARAHLRSMHSMGRSSALLFLDLTEAFYRVIRPLVLSGDLDDATISAVAQRIGLPSDALHEFHRHLRDPEAIDQARLPPYLQRALTALHDHTHFRVDGQEDHVKTTIGSRPGDCFADVIFGFLFSRILHTLESRMHHEGLITQHEPPEPHNLLQRPWQRQQAQWRHKDLICPTWMDDLCLGLDAPTAAALADKTAATASALLDVCAEHMVTPNLKRGKTEVILSFRGPGSRALRLQHYGPQSGGTMPILFEYGTAQLSTVGEYVHLGGLIHHQGVTRKELRRRFGIANAAFNQHRRLLYQNPAFSLEKRKQLFVTLVLSKLCYGMESWVLTDQRSWAFFHAALIRLYKRLLHLPGHGHFTDLEVLGRLGLPDAALLLRRCRLRYLSTLYACETDVHWPLLLRDSEWIHLLEQDLEWLGSMVINTCTLGCPRLHPGNWDYILQHHRGYWKKLVNRAFQLSGGQRRDEFCRYELHRQSFDILLLHGRFALDPEVRFDDSTLGFFGCLKCKLSFKNKAGERAHMFRCHQQVNPLRYLFDSTACPACLQECHAHSKLLGHLRNTEQCRTLLLARRQLCEPVPGSGSRLNAQQLEHHNGLLPVLQAAGPRPPQPQAPPVPLLRWDFHTAVAELCLEMDDEELFLHRLMDLGSTFTLPWTEYVTTLQATAQDLADSAEEEALSIPVSALVRQIQEASRPCNWPFLTEHRDQVDHNPRSIAAYEAWANALYAIDQKGYINWTPLHCPRVFYRERIILHAYSGRRRRGDLQWYMEALAEQKSDFLLVVVSLDIVIDKTWGDAKNPAIQKFWLTSVLDGHVCGFLGGPPCSTWSVARGKQLHNMGRSLPRVLRDLDHLWGFLSVSLKEQAQLSDGNDLLGFCILMLIALLVTDGSGLMEHPKPPDDISLASVWRLPLLRFISTLPNVEVVDLAQGLLGAPSAKPTRLLTIRLPSLTSELHANRLRSTLPKGGSIGLDEGGSFKTTPLKEYPPAMCRALASAFLNHVWRVDPPVSSASVPEPFLTTCLSMDCKTYGQHIGQDCAL